MILSIWISSVKKNILRLRAEMSEARHFKGDTVGLRRSHVLDPGCPIQ